MPSILPRAAALAVWLGGWLRGETGADVLLDEIGPESQVLVDWPGTTAAEPLATALGLIRGAGAIGTSLALPRPGDPVGLAGPPPFNLAALEAGEAILVDGTGLGLVPTVVGGAVEWRAASAAVPPTMDPAEASVSLRQTLLEVTARLVDLDVATWQPEIPDALSNLRHRPVAVLPPSYDGRRAETIDRALLCLDLVALAGGVEPGAVSAYELDQRRDALSTLDRAARRALVAACR